MSSLKQLINLLLWVNFVWSGIVSISGFVKVVSLHKQQQLNKIIPHQIISDADTEMLVHMQEMAPTYKYGSDSLINFIYANLK